MMKAKMISIKDDLGRTIGAPVDFPPIKNWLSLPLHELKGTSYFFLIVVSIISFIGLLGSVVVLRLDRKDWAEIKEFESQESWKLNLVKSVAENCGEPFE